MKTIKYAVYDPKTGENTQVDNREDAIKLFWMRMIDFARPYFHDTAYMTIEQDGETQTWYNDAGKVIDRPRTPAEIEALLAEYQTGAADGSSS